MGEIADMMIEGILCEQCGVFIGDEVGYPRNCGCDPSMSRPPPPRKPKTVKNVPCGHCKKKFGSSEARDQHTRDAHPEGAT
jgi:hypothetical protein